MIKSKPLAGRYLYPATEKELNRRWDRVRLAMKKASVEVIVMQNEGQDLAGYVRWFTDLSPDYPATVIFSDSGDMISLRSGSPSHPFPPPFLARGMSEIIAAPYFRTLAHTNDVDGKIAARKIRELNKKRIGLVNLGRMHACFYQTLKEELSDLEFIDFTDEIDAIKAVKSEDELAYIRASVWMHDKIFEAMPTIIRPGRLELEIRNDIHDLACKMGGEGFSLVLVGSNPMGKPAGQASLQYLGRRVEDGDQVAVMLESGGPGGYFCEMGRIWCLGEPGEDVKMAWACAREAQDMVAAMLLPGASCPDILTKLNEFWFENGYEKEERLFAHGQGYDLIERPGMLPSETMLLQSNMVMAIHPSAVSKTAQAFCCDNFLVTPDGGVRLQNFPRELIIL